MSSNTFAALADVVRTVHADRPIDPGLLDRLALSHHGGLTSIFAPFDHVPETAKLAVVGITPGRVQAEKALAAAGGALRAGLSLAEASRVAKLSGSFSGAQTRNNLVAMLDSIGLARRCGVSTCSELFDPDKERVHFTSALRYPVFLNGGNYRGTPSMVRTPMLRRMIETYLAAEAEALPDALWLPLGPKPAEALQHLVRLGRLRRDQVLAGLPHPSGLNGERIAAFLGRIEVGRSSAKTNVAKLLAARAALTAQISGLRA